MHCSTLVLVCTVLSCVAIGCHCYCIDSSVQSSKACLAPNDGPCCGSLSYLMKENNGTLPPSSEIRIKSDIQLNETISFVEHIQDVMLVGEGITVTCNQVDSGLVFVNVDGIAIVNITLEHCGSEQPGTALDWCLVNNCTQKFRSSLLILSSANVFISNVNVRHSIGTGLTLFCTKGNVTIVHSHFDHCKAPEVEHSCYTIGGGVFIDFAYHTSGLFSNYKTDNHNSSYTFHDCTFASNNATTGLPNDDPVRSTRLAGCGGGLCVIIRGSAKGLKLTVSNCTFSGNTAMWGGGVFVALRDSPNSVQVLFSKCRLTDNYSSNNGGGTLVEYNYTTDDGSSANDNQIEFSNSSFGNNSAKYYGGGLQIFSSPPFHMSGNTNRVHFTNCSWEGNKALSGSAVHVTPQEWDYGDQVVSPPVFSDSHFAANSIINHRMAIDTSGFMNRSGIGTFLIVNFIVHFEQTTVFIGNVGSALHLSNSLAVFHSHSNTTFQRNTAKLGGAIAVVGFSFVYVEENTTLCFNRNTAQYRGGAIYAYQGHRGNHIVTTSCFIQFRSPSCPSCSISDRNVTFSFVDNQTPTGDGNAIFSSSLRPCFCDFHEEFWSCNDTGHGVIPVQKVNFLSCIGTVHGQTSKQKSYNVTTFPGFLQYNDSFPSKAIVPGKEYQSPIIVYDQLCHSSHFSHKTASENASPGMILSQTFYNVFKVYGKPNDSAKIILEGTSVPTSVEFNITMGYCPPGFVLLNRSCMSGEDAYYGVFNCNVYNFTAHILYGYWLGFCNNSTQVICSAHCPLGFCSYNNSKDSVHVLPPNNSILDSFMCGPYRTGVLCGSCRSNHSAFYNTHTYECGPTTFLCNFGMLFYILVDLVPLTIVFIIIMVFRIDFTSGAATGFILFAQLLDSFALESNGMITFPSWLRILTKGYRFVYGILRLEFGSSSISFCLWKDATVLDVMAMKYVTIVYSFGLVFLTVFLLKTSACNRLYSCLRIRTVKSAYIHGLTAFFIMCYSQCARVSTQILEPSYIYFQGPEFVSTVLFRSGDLHPFAPCHLPYALPALFFVVVVVVLPPLLLLLYPLSCKVLAVCHLNETRVVNVLSRMVPLQLLDAFQGCYRDNYRFVAGLYFVYRNSPFLLYATTESLSQYYIQLEILFVLVLAVHAILQPYKKRCHNIIDSLLFANLAIINGITLYNFTRDDYNGTLHDQRNIVICLSLQLCFIYLPLIVMIGYIVVVNIKRWRKASVSESDSLSDDDEFPPLRSPSELHHAINYHTLDQD